jgi:CRISPR-associated protein Cas5t
LNRPEQSVVLRTVWRVKKTPLGSAGNTRPDYQQLLSPVELIIWVDSSDEVGDKPSLEERVQAGLSNPRDISRFGGLSLGESTHLVNDVCVLSDGLGRLAAETGRAFLKHPNGRLTLPIWVDHVGSAGTRFVTGDLESLSLNVSPPRERMPCIHPEGDPDDRNPESASRP